MTRDDDDGNDDASKNAESDELAEHEDDAGEEDAENDEAAKNEDDAGEEDAENESPPTVVMINKHTTVAMIHKRKRQLWNILENYHYVYILLLLS